MHDLNDHIIYVGKAVVLKNRVRQYFQKSRHVSPKIERMIEQIAWFEYIVTDSELEAPLSVIYKPMNHINQSIFITVRCHIIGAGSHFLRSICHRHTKSGIFNHRNIIK